jgi:hypothetical protein
MQCDWPNESHGGGTDAEMMPAAWHAAPFTSRITTTLAPILVVEEIGRREVSEINCADTQDYPKNKTKD